MTCDGEPLIRRKVPMAPFSDIARHKGACTYDVRKIFWFLDTPLSEFCSNLQYRIHETSLTTSSFGSTPLPLSVVWTSYVQIWPLSCGLGRLRDIAGARPDEIAMREIRGSA